MLEDSGVRVLLTQRAPSQSDVPASEADVVLLDDVVERGSAAAAESDRFG